MTSGKNGLDTLMTGHNLGIYDRRRKITEDQKTEIKDMHKRGYGIREIARAFVGICSRRSIQFILYPERLKRLQDMHRKNKHWKTYHNREKLTKATREWRRYKKKLFKANKI